MLKSSYFAYTNMATPKLVAKIEAEEPALRLAVLIDADNAQAAVIEGILGEVARFGEATVKRIYGDFTSPNSASWKKVLQKYAIKPVQQFAYTTGKNATDCTLIIDAMDLLYTRRFDGFCLVTSDSDFTGLATRIREEGLVVLGFGEQKTPDAFRNACNKFVLTELLRLAPAETVPAAARPEPLVAPALPLAAAVTHAVAPSFPEDFMLSALDQSSDENGWAHLGTFGSYLTKLQPDFDSRVYGFRKLSDLVRSRQDIFVTEERAVPGQAQKQLYLKPR
ncbi:NYN domain-containing protein [Cupriavidus sp. PET2-C1]